MGKTEALSIYVSDSVKAELRNKIAGVFENYAKKSISGRLKSKNGVQNEKTGSLEYKRFSNAERKEYGTARSTGKGSNVKAKPIVVNLDRDSEIVEEVNAFDAASFTEEDLNSFLARRKVAVQQSLERDLDREFFLAGKTGGTKGADISKAKPVKAQLGQVFVTLETTKNEYVDGVDREQMALVLSSNLYQLVKDELNDCYNFAGETADEVFKGLDGVATFSSNRLPDGVDYMLITMDSIAQPTLISETDIEKIPLSNEYAVEVFYRNGTKVLAEELVYYGAVTE
jgi:hypothetical protein